MIKKLCLVGVVLSFTMVSAQRTSVSPYSFYGIGTQQFKGTVENRSMGGLSIFSDQYHFNLQNPAALSKRRLTSFTVGGYHNEVTLEDETAKDTQRASTLDYVAIGFPITKKSGFSFGFMPYTNVGYNLDASTDEVINTFEGNGGVNRAFVSAGVQLYKGLSLGASVFYNFGNFETESVRSVEGVELGTREFNRTDVGGFNYEFGLQYEYEVKENLNLIASFIASPNAEISEENQRTVSSVFFNDAGLFAEVDVREEEVVENAFDFPKTFSAGLGISQKAKWGIGVEYKISGISDFGTSRLGTDNVSFERATSMKMGGWYTPKYNSVTSYLQKVTYRAGARLDKSGLIINGESIDEFGMSFGLGLPAGRYLSNANLGVEFGQRGTTSNGLVKENYISIGVGFSFNDLWFVKTKFN